jgi:hypothetical protein
MERLSDPKRAHDIFISSPATGMVDLLYKHLMVNLNHSRVAEKRADSIVYLVNAYPLKLNLKVVEYITAFFNVTYGAECAVISQDPATISPNLWKMLDEIYTMHLDRLSRNPGFKEECEAFRFKDRKVFAAIFFEEKVSAIDSRKAREHVINWMTTITDFRDIDTATITAPLP